MGAVESIATKIGYVPQILLEWFECEKVEGAQRDGLISSDRERIKALEREVEEPRRANEILKPTGTFFCSGGTLWDLHRLQQRICSTYPRH